MPFFVRRSIPADLRDRGASIMAISPATGRPIGAPNPERSLEKPTVTTLESLRRNLGSSTPWSIIPAGEGHAVAMLGPALVILVRHEPDQAVVDECPDWVARMLAEYPRKGIFLVIVQASARPPSEASRQRIDRVYAVLGKAVHAGAMVIEGMGFMAASIRSALSTVLLAGRYGYPLKVFPNAHEAAVFACKKLSDGTLSPSSSSLESRSCDAPTRRTSSSRRAAPQIPDRRTRTLGLAPRFPRASSLAQEQPACPAPGTRRENRAPRARAACASDRGAP